MGTILGLLGGIAAIVFVIFKGMNSTDGSLLSSSEVGGARQIETDGQSAADEIITTKTTVPGSYNAPNVAERWKIIPFKQVGLVKSDHTEADIKKYIGEENVARQEMGREWGETVPGTMVYGGLPNQFLVEWRDGRPYETIEKIRIEGDSSNWQTTQGIRVGTTLDELRAINGTEFDFFGFEWDYAGKVDAWGNGRISDGIVVYLTPENPEAVFPDLIGDTAFPSTHAKAAAADLRVSAIEIKMHEGIHF